ncbi:Fic family protein [Chlorobium limicola]|uniref:Fic family protein n=1 Tax=Chlorobium limicola TaxID=1092 RepID=UPI0023F24513|nr:hypothetical protein [Chlorobium limicola]
MNGRPEQNEVETSYGRLGVTVTFHAPEVAEEVVRMLQVIEGEMKRSEIQERLGLKHEEHFRKSYLLPALELGVIEMTIPDKPTSRLQKYRLTKKGLHLMAAMQ